MGNTYYCDLEADFADHDGSNTTDQVLTGPGGLQAAIRGTGSAPTLSAGDTLLCKGSAKLNMLAELVCGVDVGSGGLGWAVGDIVQDNDTGNEWQGKICEVDVGASGDVILVQLDNDSWDGTNIVVGDGHGIYNVTQDEQTTLDSVSLNGITWDGNAGDTTSGNIKLFGVNSSWQTYTDGDGASCQAVLDGLDCNNSLYVPASGRNFIEFRNFSFINADGDANSDGVGTATNSSSHWIFDHCIFDNNNRYSVYGLYLSRSQFLHCIFSNNSEDGIYWPKESFFFACLAYGNSSEGFNLHYHNTLYTCVAYKNTGHNVYPYGQCNRLLNCITDDSASNYGIYFRDGSNSCACIGVRSTNNALWGFHCAADHDESIITDYCLAYGNTAGSWRHLIKRSHCLDSTDGVDSDGYVDQSNADYNIKVGEELRSMAAVLNWPDE